MKAYIINTETLEYPIYEGDFRLKFSNTSFPFELEPSHPFAWVYETTQPQLENFDEEFKEILPLKDDYGIWYRQWQVYKLTADEISIKEESVKRFNKNAASRLLKDTDWTQASDVLLSNKQEFIDYRAMLRTIALNPPARKVTFPNKPESAW